MGRVAGIDLGTTYSSIAVVNKYGKPEIIANREGERITPSVVMFDGDAPMIGSMAKRSAVSSPLNVVQFAKRQMGVPSWKFRTESGDEYTAEEISALILKRLKEDAEAMLNEKITDAVITVPAYFGDPQRKATEDAGRIAGLNVRRIINEPTAAALAYGMDKGEQNQTILVYDLGGGTFDVTIMKIGTSGINVVATGGDKNLGGFDWDNELMQHLNEAFMAAGGSDLFSDPALEQDLRDKAEIAKKTLSTRDKTVVYLSAQGKSSSITVTVDEFEERTKSLLKRTGSILGFVLEDANLEWKNIDKILLVGGSTRMKAVVNLIESASGMKPSREVHPDEIVSMGAAIQGELIVQEEGSTSVVEADAFPLVEIKDVCAHSMGVIALDEMQSDSNCIVLPKNSHVPCRASDLFHTVQDNQSHVDVRVTQGEDRDPKYVTIIGESTMAIPRYPRGSPLEVAFEYDVSGMIHVFVYDKTTEDLIGEMHIKRENNRTAEEVELLRKKIASTAVN